MANRVSQVAIQVVVLPSSQVARVSQVATEVIATGTPEFRVTAQALQVLQTVAETPPAAGGSMTQAIIIA